VLSIVYHAYQECMQMIRVRNPVKDVTKENTKMFLATKLVCFAKLASTRMETVLLIVWIAILVYTRMNVVK
jgi:hypothetical protein